MEAVDVLRRAKEFLTDPERWHQGSYGTAEKTCMGGAMNLAFGRAYYDCPDDVYDTDPAILALREAIDGEYVADFNDSHSHEEVIGAFDRAILSLAADRELALISHSTTGDAE